MEINLDEIIHRFARLHPMIMNWPISRVNDPETKERGHLGVKIQKFPRGVYLQTPLGSLYLQRSFWQSVSIYSRSAPGKYNIILTIGTLCSFKEEENVRQDLASKGEQYLTS